MPFPALMVAISFLARPLDCCHIVSRRLMELFMVKQFSMYFESTFRIPASLSGRLSRKTIDCSLSGLHYSALQHDDHNAEPKADRNRA
jgi:hypothetical protein